jgi:hypothetical protein
MSAKYIGAIFIAAGLGATSVVAQPPTPPATIEADKLFYVENLPPLMTKVATVDFIRSEGGVPGPVVKGKPYSARSITESTQTLADGNRITQRNEAVVYRDSEGRTRREQTLSDIGPFQAGAPVTMIDIYDPVAGKSYVLDPNERTAREIPQFKMAIAHLRDTLEAAKAGLETFNIAVPAPGSASESVSTVSLGATRDVTVVHRSEGGRQEVRVIESAPEAIAVFPPGTTGMYEPAEDLGEQVLEGLLAKGTRMTDTIPAGTIGNERQIDIVTERWYSEAIEAMVLQRFSDPRVGETTHRLVNVVLGEPSPDLFQVPQGYEIKTSEMAEAGIRVGGGGRGQAIQFELQKPVATPAR